VVTEKPTTSQNSANERESAHTTEVYQTLNESQANSDTGTNASVNLNPNTLNSASLSLYSSHTGTDTKITHISETGVSPDISSSFNCLPDFKGKEMQLNISRKETDDFESDQYSSPEEFSCSSPESKEDNGWKKQKNKRKFTSRNSTSPSGVTPPNKHSTTSKIQQRRYRH